MIHHLEKIFHRTKNYVYNKGYKESNIIEGINPKARDVSAVFDIKTESLIVSYCEEQGLDVVIMTEETRGKIRLSDNPRWLFIVDPIDGSTNLKKNMEGFVTSIAVLPYSEKIEPKNVQYALIGNLTSGGFCSAEKGKGAFYKGPFSGFKRKRVHSSKITELNKTCVGMDLDFALNEARDEINIQDSKKIERILPLLYPERKIKHLRRPGSGSLNLMYVATGSLDADIDARDVCSAETWMAGYLLVKEAGGVFTDLKGNEISEIKNITDTTSYIASGNKELHGKIIKNLKV